MMEEILYFRSGRKWSAYRTMNGIIVETTKNFRYSNGDLVDASMPKFKFILNDDLTYEQAKEILTKEYPLAKIEAMI